MNKQTIVLLLTEMIRSEWLHLGIVSIVVPAKVAPMVLECKCSIVLCGEGRKGTNKENKTQ